MVQPVTRRLFLARFTRGAVGVAVMGVFAACGSDSDAASTTAAPATTAGTTGTTRASVTSSTGQGEAGSPPETFADSPGFDIGRVDLGFVSAYVLARKAEAVVIDTGVSGSEGQIEAGLAALGVGWGDVGHVILTHLHGDHVGSLGAVMDSATGAVGYAGEADLPAIASPRTLTPVGDGDKVLQLEIIETPGHTPGSISILDPFGGSLIAGDAMNGAGGGAVAGPNPQFTSDMATAEDSVRKLAGLNFDSVYFGHGAPLVGGAKEAVMALVSDL